MAHSSCRSVEFIVSESATIAASLPRFETDQRGIRRAGPVPAIELRPYRTATGYRGKWGQGANLDKENGNRRA